MCSKRKQLAMDFSACIYIYSMYRKDEKGIYLSASPSQGFSVYAYIYVYPTIRHYTHISIYVRLLLACHRYQYGVKTGVKLT